MKRPLKSHKTYDIEAQLRELNRLREKCGYKKVTPHKIQKLRGRIRWHLKMLRSLLPKVEGNTNPCDPASWDIKDPTEQERRETQEAFATIMALIHGSGGKW